MDGNMILIIVDECGDEIEVARYNLTGLLDDDEVDTWKDKKIAQAVGEYPEAIGFY